MTQKHFISILTLPAVVILTLSVFLCSCSRRAPKDAHAIPGFGTAQKAQQDTLINFALSFAYRKGSEPGDMDSALLIARQVEAWNRSIHDTIIQGRIFFVYSNIFREKGDTARGRLYIDSAISLLAHTSAYDALGEAYLERSIYFSDFTSEHSMITKEGCFEDADTAFARAGNKLRQADALKNMADMRLMFGDPSQAMTDLKQSLALYSAVHHKDLQGVYDLLGYLSNSIGDCPTAIKYGHLAVKTANELNDTSMQLCTIYNRLAISYLNNHNPVDAEQNWAKSMAVAIKYLDRTAIYGIISNYITSMLGQQKWDVAISTIREIENKAPPASLMDSLGLFTSYTNAYVKGQRYESAKIYAEKLIGILHRAEQRQFFVEPAYRSLISYFMALKQYKEANVFVSGYVAFCELNTYTMGQSMAYMLKFQVDSALGNYHEAIIYYHAHKHLADSMAIQSQKMQIAQLQVQYETDKKDQDLRFKQQDIELLTNKSQLQDANLKKETLVRNVIIATAVLLLILGMWAYRVKQRHNNKLEAQQEEIHEQNVQLKELLTAQKKLVSEKEWLVREIHHRVKNNLQIIISLLNAQTEFLHDPSALDAIKESRERMQAVALIHQKLYQPDHSTQICMKTYISEMVSYLSSSFTDIGRIRFVMDIDDIDLDVSQSVPLGLILNEGITNAIKYAFPDGIQGIITISLRRFDEENIQLKIADNGRGFPEHFDTSGSMSLGMQLIRLFAEQLDGELSFRSGDGVEILLLFKQSKAEA